MTATRFLMCKPDYYGVKYEINPWMDVHVPVDAPKARAQWENLYRTLLAAGAQIDLLTPDAAWPDMVFTANAGLYYQQHIILAHFKYAERQGEVPFYLKWFQAQGFEVKNAPPQNPYFFEGAGDALTAGHLLFVGFGFRTQREFFSENTLFKQNKLVYCGLVDPYFYHLDTCFCPLTDALALWYPPAFAPDAQQQMRDNIELISVNEAEAKHFACNAVVVGNQVILPSGCPEISAKLEQNGFIVHACDMGEFIKAGGACKCLTLRID